MKYMSLYKFLLVGVVWVFVGCFRQNAPENIVVVDVNGQKLTAKVFAQRLARKLRTFDVLKVKELENIEYIKNEIIHDFIHEAIVSRWAEQNNLTISPQEIKEAMDQIRNHYSNDMSFRQSLVESRQTLPYLKRSVQKRLLEKKVLGVIRENIRPPTQKELRSYYNANKHLFRQEARVYLQHFLFETESMAQGLLEKLKSSNLSAHRGPQNNIWVEKGTSDIFEKAFTMKKGAWSRVLKSPYGYHIYRVLRKKPNKQWTFQDVKGKIYKTLMATREQATYSSWLEEQVHGLDVLRNNRVVADLQIETIGEH